MPTFTGAARDFIPQAFDLVFHTDVVNVKGAPKYVMQWSSEPTKAAKSRFGDLADNRILPNEWAPLVEWRTSSRFFRRPLHLQTGGAQGLKNWHDFPG